MKPALLFHYRLSLGVFILGLVLSGLTAFPLLTELRLIGSWLGVAQPVDYRSLTGLQHWIGFVLHGLENTSTQFPFLAYGTDWLAFGHLCLAVFSSVLSSSRWTATGYLSVGWSAVPA